MQENLSSNSRCKSKNDADEAVSVVSLTFSSGGYINGRNFANLESLIDKTSSIYLYVKLKALASCIFLSFTSFWRNYDSYEYKNKSARRGAQFVPIGMPTTCWRRQICYRWGTPAYWSLVPRSSMFYLFEFCLNNMWNCTRVGRKVRGLSQ